MIIDPNEFVNLIVYKLLLFFWYILNCEAFLRLTLYNKSLYFLTLIFYNSNKMHYLTKITMTTSFSLDELQFFDYREEHDFCLIPRTTSPKKFQISKIPLKVYIY